MSSWTDTFHKLSAHFGFFPTQSLSSSSALFPSHFRSHNSSNPQTTTYDVSFFAFLHFFLQLSNCSSVFKLFLLGHSKDSKLLTGNYFSSPKVRLTLCSNVQGMFLNLFIRIRFYSCLFARFRNLWIFCFRT